MIDYHINEPKLTFYLPYPIEVIFFKSFLSKSLGRLYVVGGGEDDLMASDSLLPNPKQVNLLFCVEGS